MILFENCEDIATGFLFKRMKPRKMFLTKAKALVKIFEVVFFGVLSYKVRSYVMFAKTFLNPSISNGKSCL